MDILRKILDLIPSWKFLQRFYKILHTVSIRGMNYGGGSSGLMSTGEINVFKYLQKQLQNVEKTQVLFDVGANIGGYAEMLLRFFPKRVQIYSFEPSEKTFKALVNNLHNTNIKCIPIGFGVSKEKVKLYHGKNSTHSSLFDRRKSVVGKTDSSELVTISTIDDFCKENNIKEIFFLKLDIEGNELNALKGADDLLKKRKIYHIQFEFGGTNVDSRVFFRDFWLMLRDYHIYRVVGNGLHPIKAYDESLEIFYYANYLATLK